MITNKGDIPIFIFKCAMCKEETVSRYDSESMNVDYNMMSSGSEDVILISKVSKKCDTCGFEIIHGHNIMTIDMDKTDRERLIYKLDRHDLHEQHLSRERMGINIGESYDWERR